MKENKKNEIALTIAGFLVGAIILILITGLMWYVNVGEQPTSKASSSSGPDEILRFENEYTVDEDGNKTFTDGILSATFNKGAGTLTFSGKGAVSSHQEWLDLEDEKKFVKTIIFQNGITSIDNSEFDTYSNYVNLEAIIFEGDINVIGDYAFSSNYNLQKVEFKGKCRRIGTAAFFECYALEEIEIPKGCNVHPWAFKETPLEPENQAEGGIDENEEIESM